MPVVWWIPGVAIEQDRPDPGFTRRLDVMSGPVPNVNDLFSMISSVSQCSEKDPLVRFFHATLTRNDHKVKEVVDPHSSKQRREPHFPVRDNTQPVSAPEQALQRDERVCIQRIPLGRTQQTEKGSCQSIRVMRIEKRTEEHMVRIEPESLRLLQWKRERHSTLCAFGYTSINVDCKSIHCRLGENDTSVKGDLLEKVTVLLAWADQRTGQQHRWPMRS